MDPHKKIQMFGSFLGDYFSVHVKTPSLGSNIYYINILPHFRSKNTYNKHKLHNSYYMFKVENGEAILEMIQISTYMANQHHITRDYLMELITEFKERISEFDEDENENKQNVCQ